VADEMARADDGLVHGQTGQPTQQAEAAAHDGLIRLIDLLRPAEPKPGGGESPSGEGGGGNSGQPNQLVELKLLELMQEDLNTRYQQLRDAKPTPQTAAQRADLAAEQGRLAELAIEMAEASENEADQEPVDQGPQVEPPMQPDKDPLGPRKDPI
jgi:hypothetical protein